MRVREHVRLVLRKLAKQEWREAVEDLLMMCELIGYMVVFGAVSHMVRTTPWHDGLIALIFFSIMVVRRFQRWRNKVESGPR